MAASPLARWLSTALLLAATPAFAQPAPPIYRLEIRDTIQPVAAWRLQRALATAAADHAPLLVELDTPGGLLDTTREMVGAILASPVPVILYIAPAGARAGSAGFFLLESADLAVMAPGTNAGAAHPVLEGAPPDDTMRQKLENDADAFLRSYTTRRNRNPALAEEAIRTSRSFSADEALQAGLIDLIAPDDAHLLAALDNRTLTRLDGSRITLHTAGTRLLTLPPTLRDTLLSRLANPNLALLLLAAGALLIYLEFNTPGTIVPGSLGAILVLVSLFALNLLPIRHTAVALIAAALVLLVLELKFPTHGILAAASILCLTFGTLTLIAAPIPEMRVNPWLAVSLSLTLGILTLVLMRLALRARHHKFLLGAAAMVGHQATTLEPIGPDTPAHPQPGHVLVQGEIWEARSPSPLPPNTPVQVISASDSILTVAPR